MTDEITPKTATERALAVQVDLLHALNAKLALSADRERLRRQEMQRILEAVRDAMADNFGITIAVDADEEERE